MTFLRPESRCRDAPCFGAWGHHSRCRSSTRCFRRSHHGAHAATTRAHRFLAFYVPNGMAMEYWTPKGEGTRLRALADPASRSRRSGTRCSCSRASTRAGTTSTPAPRARSSPARTRGGKNEIEILADVSMDQLLARHFARRTQVASLELSMDAPANAGACTGILSCVYTHTISWRSPTQPLPME